MGLTTTVTPIVTRIEINCIKEIIELLYQFEKLKKEFSGNSYVTASKVIPLISCVCEDIERIKSKYYIEFAI